jgi:ubiquitin-protein ligase
MASYDNDHIEALQNDYAELIRAFNPDIVKIEPVQASIDMMCKLKVTVTSPDRPSYVLANSAGKGPKQSQSIVFFIDVPAGYPAAKPDIYYQEGGYLAHVNAFRHGAQCTDTWKPYSSLLSIAEKTIKAIIYVPEVVRYDSMANSDLRDWQKDKTASGEFPLFSPELIYARYKKHTSLPVVSARVFRPLPAR